MADWLQVEIVTGLQKLFALRLPGTPPEDAIVGTAEVWLEAVRSTRIEWDQSLDTPRVRRAFASLFRLCDRWPVPKLFIDNLGSRAPPKALPAPAYPADQAKRNLARIKHLLHTQILNR